MILVLLFNLLFKKGVAMVDVLILICLCSECFRLVLVASERFLFISFEILISVTS